MKNRVVFASKLASYPEPATEQGHLTSDVLTWHQDGREGQLSLADVVGTSEIYCGNDNRPCLLVSAYPLRQAGLFGKQKRVLQEYIFTFPDLSTRSQWQRAIDNTLRGQPVAADIVPRRLQIVINPNSGKRKAVSIFDRVRPLLERSNIEFVVSETTSREDTKDYIRRLDLESLTGLVIVGGDGTIHDAIAGLMERSDCTEAIKLPLGVIPGGTGNGLSKTLLEQSGASYDPLNAAFSIIRGRQKNLDLAKVKQGKAEYYSFLSLAWGLISDVDIESEKLKFLGALRFYIYALILLALARTYRGRFSFIPHPDCQMFVPPTVPQRGKWRVIEDDFIFLWGMNTAWAAYDMNVTPLAQIDDGTMDVLVMRQGTSRWEILQALVLCGKGKHLDLPHLEYYKVIAMKLEPLTKKGILVVDGEPVEYAPIQMEVLPHLARVTC